MHFIKVLIPLPRLVENDRYVYRVPEQWGGEIEAGQRVLVAWGNRPRTGWIMETGIEPGPGITPQPILKVLDAEPVLNITLLHLAEWIANRYCCPLATVLRAMLPSLTAKEFLWTGGETAAEETVFPESLAGDGQPRLKCNPGIGRQPFRNILDQEQLKQLEKSGQLVAVDRFPPARTDWSAYEYRLGDFSDTELSQLRKRAPRQAEAVAMLLEAGSMEAEKLRRIYAPAVLGALNHKGFITLEQKTVVTETTSLLLNKEQESALAKIQRALQTDAYHEFLLWGITGSGKTEVYMRAARHAMQLGKKTLLLVPEIALTRQLVELFTARFGQVAVLHSQITPSKRYDQWQSIKSGQTQLILGTRMAVFAPIEELGLIIVDEEQESSFKQEQSPRYHARDVARQRAKLEKAVFLAGSATPALETYFRLRRRPQDILLLQHRATQARLAEVRIEDMRQSFRRGATGIISPALQENLQVNLAKGQQTILFVHRRGYSPMTICRECGNIATCKSCSVALTYHQDRAMNVCHYCNYQCAPLAKCTECGSVFLQQIGYGTQKVEEEVAKLFPSSRIARLDVDTSRTKGWQQSVLGKMKKKQIDILVGTQMVAKGFDFPFVSLVGVVDADGILNLPDFRASERCFQLVVQAAGRAGRGNEPGRVIIQTYNPDHYIIRTAAQQDYLSFVKQELAQRRWLKYPPYSRLLRLVVSTVQEETAKQEAVLLTEQIEAYIDAREESIQILGPAPCPIARIKKKYRYQIFVKSTNALLLSSIGKHIYNNKKKYTARVDVDMDPIITM